MTDTDDDRDYSLLSCGNCAQWKPNPGNRLGKCQRARVQQLADDPIDAWPRTARLECCCDWTPDAGAARYWDNKPARLEIN